MSWTVVDTRRDNEREFDTKADAEETVNDLRAMGASPEDLHIERPDGEVLGSAENEVKSDGGETTAEVVEAGTEPTTDATEQLPDKPPVDEDPLVWMPDEFTDTIDGSVAINRKGCEVLAHHYDISTSTEMVTSLVDSGGEHVIHKATAETKDGTTYTAYGEAHKSHCDPNQMVRMSDTRANKRAVLRATGIGMVAVQELQNEL